MGSLFVEADEEVFVFVEAWDPDAIGDFELQLTLARGRCDEPVDVPVEAGSDEGIVLWGFTGQQENGAVGSCGGAGRDVTYLMRPVGNVSSLQQVRMDVVQSFPFNAVLHARTGVCTDLLDQVECSNFNGSGTGETIDGFALSPDADERSWVFADSSSPSSNGGFVLHPTPPVP